MSSRLPPSLNGQSIVEFALLIPVLLLMLLGAVDLGRAYAEYVAITNAAREGARYGASHFKDAAGNLNTAGIANRAVQEAALGGLVIDPSADVQIDCSPYGTNTYSAANCAAVVEGDELRVTITHNFQFLTLYLFRLPSVPMSNLAIMSILKTTALRFGGLS